MQNQRKRLPVGYKIKMVSGATAVVKSYIGGGGQGDVYRVDYNGAEKALKWYNQNQPQKQFLYQNTQLNIKAGKPADSFVWPEDISEWVGDTFGYIMEFIPEGYYEIIEFITVPKGKELRYFRTTKVQCDAIINTAKCLSILHDAGFAYLDVNWKNILANQETGDIRICDCDNCVPNREQTGIMGTPKFIAPEIMQGKNGPDAYSDNFSLAVLIFLLVTKSHPFEGEHFWNLLLDDVGLLEAYGMNPVFIYDEDDDTNRPVKECSPGAIIAWENFMPDYVKKLFRKMFGKQSILNPQTRPLEWEWIKTFSSYKNEFVRCGCGAEMYIGGAQTVECWNCKKKYNFPYVIDIVRNPKRPYRLTAVPGARIYKCHLGVWEIDEAADTAGLVRLHPDDNRTLVLQNLGDDPWEVVNSEGGSGEIGKGRAIRIRPGTKVSINGKPVIEIKGNA